MVGNVDCVLHDLLPKIFGVEWYRLAILANDDRLALFVNGQAEVIRGSAGSARRQGRSGQPGQACGSGLAWQRLTVRSEDRRWRRENAMLLEGALSLALLLGEELDRLLEQVEAVREVRAEVTDLVQVVWHFVGRQFGPPAPILESSVSLRVAIDLRVRIRSIVQIQTVQAEVLRALHDIGRLFGLLDLVEALHLRQITARSAILFEEPFVHICNKIKGV